jgi:acyl-CoA synthetase (AMP-forming)/AMP-acid ligase II
MNFVEPILFQAKHDPPAPAMCAPGTALGIVSYARLARFIYSVGHRAVRLGIAPGQVVAIHVKDHIFHAALALGFMHIGAATVSVGASLAPGLRVDVIVTDTPEAFGNGRQAKVVAVDLSWMSGKSVPVDERHVYRGNGNDFCRIALTSGSTGEAKAVGFTHNNQLARLGRYNHVFGNLFPQYSRFFSDYGLGSSGGFRHILYVLSRGGTIFFPGASPMETLQIFALYKVQGLIASPGGLSGFLTFYDTNRDFPCSFDIFSRPAARCPIYCRNRCARACARI